LKAVFRATSLTLNSDDCARDSYNRASRECDAERVAARKLGRAISKGVRPGANRLSLEVTFKIVGKGRDRRVAFLRILF